MKNKTLSYLLIYSLLSCSFPSFAKSTSKKSASTIDLKELALPSEVEGLGKIMGSIYYSPVIKGKVLIPVHIWGEVQKPGLHFIPIGSSLVEGLSIAGGVTATAKSDNIKLTQRNGDTVETRSFDVSEGGDSEAFATELKPRDTIFAERSTFREDRAYYTSLIGVVATILSSIIIYREVRKN
ncbi:MAG: hypothetical protein COW01_01645 [Bdellovibrionales bacterium CG12_big_fil_rev_8_21_14_0_65_38_15]|nr:MAG: hypothetical protein COW79_00195 [Bdellovibrionales bacterium CG22_combo_CG10-13_8_21_14_all_38_13]PIQ57175.1 MAG: hypothetical protein COW01_01645 [Bdellovibrionales bacterium CG12_big_fil_rev_8_21_14_0_65_38_15]PIR31369.1 MAG: hypothetical protein COV38_00735 [Bdellovibrionales bacterium CG11_big_fil_rev_8_21_14_0_20_38_13]